MLTFLSPKIKGLLSSEISFYDVFDEIPSGIVILDSDFRIVYVNRSIEALTGFTHEDALGIKSSSILRSRFCIEQEYRRNKKVQYETQCVETDIINRERCLIPVRLTVSGLNDENGELVGYIKTVEDLRPIREHDAQGDQAYSFTNIIGRSPQMEKVFRLIPVLSQSDASILITGETGTGKDLVAEAVHQASSRAKGAFIKVNCGALPETLLESELFGHQKGAFTGAVENKPGRFRLAHNGTIFLTEIGDLPLSLQVKLLTFLDDRVVYPLGSTKGFQANVRIIAATHRNLEQMVKHGQFRQDLFFRLNVARIHLPPLREREDDIKLLFTHFLSTFKSHLKKKIKGFSGDALQVLMNYHYSGNVRELRNIIEYAVNICQADQIELEDLPGYIVHPDSAHAAVAADAGEDVPVEKIRTVRRVSGDKWSDVERKLIIEALIDSGGRKSKAAEALGWGRSTLWRKMKQYEIDS